MKRNNLIIGIFVATVIVAVLASVLYLLLVVKYANTPVEEIPTWLLLLLIRG